MRPGATLNHDMNSTQGLEDPYYIYLVLVVIWARIMGHIYGPLHDRRQLIEHHLSLTEGNPFLGNELDKVLL